MVAAKHRNFRSWLAAEIDAQKIPRRELARRLASKHPKGATTETVETYRRAIYRYLDVDAPMIPNTQTRRAFAEALGVHPDEVPSSDEEDEQDMAAALQALVRENAEVGRKLTRVLRAVKA